MTPISARRAALPILVALVLLAAPAARAQNFGAMFQNAVRDQVNTAVSAAFRSVTQPSSGRISVPLPFTADTEGRVIFYRNQQCGYCRQAASYMDQNGIPYVERYVDRNPDYNAEFTRLGGRGVPLLVFGRRTLNGFNGPLISRYYQEMTGGQGADYLPHGNPSPGDGAPPPYPAAPSHHPVGGDALTLKLATLNILTAPNRDASVLVTLTLADRLIYLGEERNGLYRVASDKGEGWVDKQLVRPQRRAW